MLSPLCESIHINKLTKIDKNQLLYSYKKLTNIDFGYLITQDIYT